MKYVEGSRRVFLNTGTKFPREIISAIGLVKYAAASANVSLGLLDREVGRAIMRESRNVMKGKLDTLFVVDVFQTGSGTGLNMNANEVISEAASAELGKKVHPNDHVNMSQSSNDVGPTAVRIASIRTVEAELLPAMALIVEALSGLSRRTSRVYKAGRTHLRDALPVTMGQEFGAYADAFRRDSKAIRAILPYLCEVPIGGTAVGTGVNADPRFGRKVVEVIRHETGLPVREAENKFRATRLLTDMELLSSSLKVAGLDLFRLCQDLRLMFSGPVTGIGEIDIPSQEEVAGSSIMPGKTNPVTVESAMLACSQIVGLDSANQVASTLGEFELAMGVPLLGYNLIIETKLLAEALRKISSVVIDKVVPFKDRSRTYAESSPSLITLISPTTGYDKASVVGKKLAKGTSIRQALKELGYSQKQIDKMLDLKDLVKPGIQAKKL